jgi:hypothetical protein
MDADQLTATVLEVLSRAPAWVRTDLASQDTSMRQRAEEVLATLIAAALIERDQAG